jgi:hypothetical protein
VVNNEEDQSADMLTVSVFRRQLDLPFNTLVEEDIQRELEKRHFQQCVIEYDQDEFEKFPEIMSAKKISFFGDANDLGGILASDI